MFGTDLGCGVDDLLNQPCEVAEKSLEVRNQFSLFFISIPRDYQRQQSMWEGVEGSLDEHTPIPWVGTLNLMCT